MSAPLYLDYQATTPLDPDALSTMMPYLTSKFGNPHSAEHRYGWEGKAGVDVARAQVARLINVPPAQLIFTSGATEANGLALRGVLARTGEQRRRLITVATEHSCVLETANALERQGFSLTILPVQSDGLVSLDSLVQALGDDTALVSVMLVNNEIGVIQPIQELARLAHLAGALFHCDAAQAAGKIAVDGMALDIDLMSLSAHKLYGPKGIGALYIRSGLMLEPQLAGGGQEQGWRSGTLSPALCAGFGAAAAKAHSLLADEHRQYADWWQRIVTALRSAGIDFVVNGSVAARFFGNLNISFPGLDGGRLLADLRGLALSSGAACASAAGKASYVLAAIGQRAGATLRIGLGRLLTDSDIDSVIARLIAAVRLQQPVLSEPGDA